MNKDAKIIAFVLLFFALGICITYFAFLSDRKESKKNQITPIREEAITVKEPVETVDMTEKNTITPIEMNPSPEHYSKTVSMPAKRDVLEIDPDVILTDRDFMINEKKDQRQMLVNQPNGIYYKLIAEIVDPQEGEVIADIGCGTGPLPFILSPYVGKKGRIFAIDTQDEALRFQLSKKRKLARKYIGLWDFNNVTVFLNDHDNILLEQNLIDKAVMSGVHIFNFDPERTGGKEPRKDSNGNILKEQIIRDIINPRVNCTYDHASFGRSLYNSIKPNGKLYIIEFISTKQWALGEKEVPEVLKAFGFELEKFDNTSINGFAIWVFKKT